MTLSLVIFALLQTAPAPVTARLLSYEETVRCAGVTQAASELEGGETTMGQALSDAALYWSLTAGQAAITAGKTASAADTDQASARIRAVRELKASSPATRADLERCRRRTPNLG